MDADILFKSITMFLEKFDYLSPYKLYKLSIVSKKLKIFPIA